MWDACRLTLRTRLEASWRLGSSRGFHRRGSSNGPQRRLRTLSPATPGQAADGSRTVVKLDAEAALAAVRSAYRPADSAAFVMIHDKAARARMVTVPAHVPA